MICAPDFTISTLLFIMSPTPLQIKTKALQRLIKERSLYSDEVLQHKEFLDQMKSSGADQYDVRKQSQILDESERMVVELERKIADHKDSLTAFLGSYSGDEDLSAAKALV